MIWLDQKYIGFLGPYLTEFKKIDATTYNFRCPVCGDSAYKRKKRGYFYFKKGKYSFFCHNCSASMSLPRFLKERHPDLYGQYLVEKLEEDKKENVNTDLRIFEYKFKKPEFVKNSGLKSLKKISSLPADHPAKQYIVSRKIPNPYHAKLFLVDKFKAWVNEQVPDKFDPTKMDKDDARIVIPLIDRENRLVGVQGRSLDPVDKIRYISIMLDDEAVKLYNFETCDPSKDVYVFEGPFDAMFLPNSIASCGGHLTSNLVQIDDVVNKEKFIICYDNEPRNKDIVRNIGRAIKQGFRTVIWPSDFEYKDVNDAIKDGMEVCDIQRIIDKRTFMGLEAELEFNVWKKTAGL